MRLELIRVGLLVELANHYTTKGAWLNKAETKNESNEEEKETGENIMNERKKKRKRKEKKERDKERKFFQKKHPGNQLEFERC